MHCPSTNLCEKLTDIDFVYLFEDGIENEITFEVQSPFLILCTLIPEIPNKRGTHLILEKKKCSTSAIFIYKKENNFTAPSLFGPTRLLGTLEYLLCRILRDYEKKIV